MQLNPFSQILESMLQLALFTSIQSTKHDPFPILRCQRWGAAYVERSAKPSHFTRDGPCLVDASLALGVCGDFLSPEGPRGGASSWLGVKEIEPDEGGTDEGILDIMDCSE